MLSFDDLLGLVYVSSWSISMYPPIITNWRHKSTSAISVDFVMLNTAGYSYLVISIFLQLYFWQLTDDGSELARPKLTQFDFWYCLHGCIMNVVLLTQVVAGARIWRFPVKGHRKMKLWYLRILLASLAIFATLSVQFMYANCRYGWDNSRTLVYCNNLFLLKISMSLIKYIPQVTHNWARKSMECFPIQGVFLDITGGIASLLQLIWQLSSDKGFSLEVFVTNFGKIGLSMVTLIFNFIFIMQWLVYRAQGAEVVPEYPL
ncbi:ers1p [Saccharomyces arboricola H-6]|uniref:Ers1p n=1 Tax=Saccharomyces arboricola (strain H-6 / AS 2.3317 / CBS 10644) TaxID=1160507 RepID=J8Q465_SACAR|nr:ers1p [Saccharomyces arboricola H-6]